MQQNPKRTNIAINNNVGALTLISGTILASRVEIIEDPNYNAGTQQGLKGYILDPNVVPPETPVATPAGIQVWLPNAAGQQDEAHEPIVFGGEKGRVHGAFGQYTSASGTPLVQLTTNSSTAGGVILSEWP